MARVKGYDFCILGSGVIVNRLIRESHISHCKTLIVSDQMYLGSSNEESTRNITIRTRRQFIDLESGTLIHTLIVSVKTNLWNNENELELLLHKARECRANRVVLLSSGSVYGESVEFSNEYSLLEPVNEYGRHKLLEEVKTVDIFQEKAQILVLRISNVYGDRIFDDITNRCIKSVKESTPLMVYSSGTLTRDFIYIEDLVKILGKLIQTEFTSGLDYLNVSSGKGTSIAEMIKEISNITSQEINLLDVARPTGVVKSSVLENFKLRERVSTRHHTLGEGLMKYISSQFAELIRPA